MSVSFFVGPLRCDHCGTTAPSDTSTDMQTHLGDRANEVWGVGDAVPATEADLRSSYLALGPHPSGAVHLLQDWTCPACGASRWADVEVTGGRVTAITAVPLDAAAAGRADYVSEGIEEVLAGLGASARAAGGAIRADLRTLLVGALTDAP